jgi:CheY-like chemotaxis protein
MSSSASGSDVALGQTPENGVVHDTEDGVEGTVARPAPSTVGHRDPRLSGEAPISGPRPLTILLYSDDSDTRARVRRAIGRRVAADLPPVEWTECATEPAVIREVDRGGFDLLILDGETSPAGGLGVCKQLKDEKYECPPVLVLTGRPQDAWLATWSRADAAVPHPLDPRALAETVAALARRVRS